MQKTYFRVTKADTKDYQFQLPYYFINSKSDEKYIVVRYCKLLFGDPCDNHMVNDIRVHSDMVQTDNYVNSFVCFANDFRAKDICKFRYNTSQQKIKLWFEDMFGHNVNELVQEFLLDMLLIY